MVKRYRFDDELKNDPVEYQRIQELFKVEVAFLVTVRISAPRLGSSERSLLQLDMSIITPFLKPCQALGTLGAHWVLGCSTVGFSYRPVLRRFSIRHPGITVTANVAQLLAFPADKLLEAILPSGQFTTFGYIWCLDPRKSNLKEHMVITILANIGFFTPYPDYVRLLVISPVQSRDRKSVV